mgnify:CR=1 FL=1
MAAFLFLKMKSTNIRHIRCYNGTMNQVQCAYCFSTNVTIVSSEETRQVISVQCLDCGKLSQIDVENFQVDTDDLPSE